MLIGNQNAFDGSKFNSFTESFSLDLIVNLNFMVKYAKELNL